jgi:hypothetical protein
MIKKSQNGRNAHRRNSQPNFKNFVKDTTILVKNKGYASVLPMQIGHRKRGKNLFLLLQST